VERRTDPQNGRQRRLTLTQSGRSLLASVMDHRRAALRQLMEGLPADARGELVSAMGTLAAQSRFETDVDSWVVPTGPRRI
jgi:DNA-binding MarR family transcriptional regulator